ncbi:MAG: FAD-dependent oxidoreductase, partial [Proteobacteria bacterium]|nr:FAD-dependent oxidoreductase [Pseudomonadota bacterium]
HIKGRGFFEAHSLTKDGLRRTSVKLTSGGQTQILSKNVIIATGSQPRALPLAAVDHHIICDSTDALSFPSIPKKLAIIGGGVIGLELGSVWQRLGTEVVILEAQPSLLEGMDSSLGKYMVRHLKNHNITLHLSCHIESVTISKKGAVIKGSAKNQTNLEVLADKVLYSVGRQPNTEGLGLEQLGDNLRDHRGYIITDHRYATKTPGIFAIGDVIKGPMLAHKAEVEGVAVSEILAGQTGYVNYHTIPNVIYTWPEVASIGFNDRDLKQQNLPFKQGSFALKGNARAKVWGDDSGFIKMYADPKTDEVLGVHMVSPHASELVAEMAVAMNFKASAEDIARTCHAHPSLSEAIKESALASHNRSLHS